MSPRRYNGSVFHPAGREHLYVKYWNPDSRKVMKRVTPFVPGEEDQAREWLQAMVARLGTTSTVAGWAREWLDRRRRSVADWKNDEQRLRDYILPRIGGRELAEVEPRDIVGIIEALKAKEMAPRTIRNTYSVLRSLYRDAVMEGLLPRVADPCILKKAQLGKAQDAELGWRAGAVFSRGELEQLLTDPRIPLDRRVQYGLLGVAGLRDGEMCGLRWERIQVAEPLARIVVAASYGSDRTKTGMERWMPVHPVLRELLSEWYREWPAVFGRAPSADDLVLPTPPATNRGPRVEAGSMRDKSWVYKRWLRDLRTLGLPHRRVHDLRRTLISLAKADGANEDILRWGTHAPPTHVMGLYTSVEWGTLCAEIAKLRISRERRDVPAPQALGPAAPLFGPGDPAPGP